MEQRLAKKSVSTFFVFVFFCFSSVAILQLSIARGVGWPMSLSALTWTVNACLYAAWLAVWVGIWGTARPAGITALLSILLLGTLHSWKLNWVDTPLQLADLWRFSSVQSVQNDSQYSWFEGFPLARFVWLSLGLTILGLSGWWLAELGPVFKAKTLRGRLGSRASVVLLGLLFLRAWVPAQWSKDSFPAHLLHRFPNIWSKTVGCERDGFIWCFLEFARTPKFARPTQQAQAEAARLLLPTRPPPSRDSLPDRVVILILESFWDPAELHLPEKNNPLPFYRSLLPKFAHGRHLAPRIGGFSLHTHFELLTGIPTAIFPDTVIPTLDFASPRLPSLALKFRQMGYQTSVVSAGAGTIWNAENAYAAYGIEKSLFLDQLKDPEWHGPWVTDKTIVREALGLLESVSSPQFLVASTVEGHAPYPSLANEDSRFFYESELPKRELDELNAFAWRLRATDHALHHLLDKMQEMPGWNVVLILGDHRPPIRAAVGTKLSPSALAHDSPLLLWSNRPGRIQGSQDWNTATPWIGPQFLERLGVPLDPPYWQSLKTLSMARPEFGLDKKALEERRADPLIQPLSSWADSWLSTEN